MQHQELYLSPAAAKSLWWELTCDNQYTAYLLKRLQGQSEVIMDTLGTRFSHSSQRLQAR